MKKVISFALTLAMCLSLGGAALGEASDSLYALAEKSGFKLGAAFSYNQLNDDAYLTLVKQHFNSVTPTNELKAYSLLDQSISKLNKDGMPGMHYTQADKMMTYAMEQGIAVRGHVLVWDAYMTDWFFHEGYDQNKPYADQETIRARVKSYIEQVITHFEEKFPGVIYCWDVVNEAVGDNAGEYLPDDPRHLRTMRNGEPNPFYEYMGSDYVELSFLYTRDIVEKLGAKIELYYNDYNAFMADKSKAMLALVDSINAYAKDANGESRKLIDGVGMQGYIGGYGTQSGCLNDGDLSKIKSAIEAYAQKGMSVQVTEMAVRSFVGDEATMQKHAEFYAKLFKMFKAINRADENKPLKAVTIWGLFDAPYLPKDNYSYRLNGPYCGLFDENYQPKPAYEQVKQVLLEE